MGTGAVKSKELSAARHRAQGDPLRLLGAPPAHRDAGEDAGRHEGDVREAAHRARWKSTRSSSRRFKEQGAGAAEVRSGVHHRSHRHRDAGRRWLSQGRDHAQGRDGGRFRWQTAWRSSARSTPTSPSTCPRRWSQKFPNGSTAAGAAVDSGYVQRKGDRLVCKIEFKNGALTMNGKPQAIPGLGGPPAESTREAIRPHGVEFAPSQWHHSRTYPSS